MLRAFENAPVAFRAIDVRLASFRVARHARFRDVGDGALRDAVAHGSWLNKSNRS
jgi:hypothetical protein